MPDDKTSNSELFSGSIDRSRLDEMKAAAGDDPVRQAQIAEVQAQVDAVAESDAAADDARQRTLDARRQTAEAADRDRRKDASGDQRERADSATPSQQTQPAPGEDLSSLSKPELVDRAKAAGVDTTGKNKDELVNDLNRRAR